MDRHAAKLAAAAAALALAVAASALDWPSDRALAASTFGTSVDGRFSTGILVAPGDGLVRTAAGGDVAFALDDRTLPGGFPSTLGAFVVIAHDRDLSTVYGRLDPGSVSGYLKAVRERDILGRAGGSGYGPGSAAFFGVFDRARDAWVNPLVLLSGEPDTTPPTLRGAWLVNAERSYRLGEARTVRQGRYRLALDATDPVVAGVARAPYLARLLVDGVERAAVRFDSAAAVDGVLRRDSRGQDAAAGLYDAAGRLSLGDFDLARGAALVTLEIADFEGNRREASFQLGVDQ